MGEALGNILTSIVPNSHFGRRLWVRDMAIFRSHVGSQFSNFGYMEVYRGIWRSIQVYKGICRHMKVYGGYIEVYIYRYMEVYRGMGGLRPGETGVVGERRRRRRGVN